jgi:hypothetical protein
VHGIQGVPGWVDDHRPADGLVVGESVSGLGLG